jgi:hypothetical protein
MKIIKITCVLLLLFIIGACDNAATSDRNVMNDRELKKFVDSHLQVGDDREKIEVFFRAQGWSFGFNQFKSRYECHYKPGDIDKWYMNSGVGIRIYIDKDERFIRSEIVRLATGF